MTHRKCGGHPQIGPVQTKLSNNVHRVDKLTAICSPLYTSASASLASWEVVLTITNLSLTGAFPLIEVGLPPLKIRVQVIVGVLYLLKSNYMFLHLDCVNIERQENGKLYIENILDYIVILVITKTLLKQPRVLNEKVLRSVLGFQGQIVFLTFQCIQSIFNMYSTLCIACCNLHSVNSIYII